MSTIYVDMDGVVADFDGYVRDKLGFKNKPGIRFTQEEWVKIREYNPRIYRNLPVLNNAEQIVTSVQDIADYYHYDVKFLTAVPKENDLGWAFCDKIDWVQENFPGIPVWFGPYSTDKQRHHRPGDILIDDRKLNIEEWRSVGGRAILHTGDADQTITELESLM
jgi:5'(3')-deoxyribonucleotidase